MAERPDPIVAGLMFGNLPYPESWREHARTCERCSEFQGVPCPIGSQLIREESDRRHLLRRHGAKE